MKEHTWYFWAAFPALSERAVVWVGLVIFSDQEVSGRPSSCSPALTDKPLDEWPKDFTLDLWEGSGGTFSSSSLVCTLFGADCTLSRFLSRVGRSCGDILPVCGVSDPDLVSWGAGLVVPTFCVVSGEACSRGVTSLVGTPGGSSVGLELRYSIGRHKDLVKGSRR